MRKLLLALTRNPVSLAGALLATFSAAIILTLFLLQWVGFEGGPYIGILAYLIFPVFFGIGLILIPLGMRREKRRRSRGEKSFPILDLNQDSVRRATLIVFALSIVNVIVFATVTYKGVEVMESNEFCGTACHSVMQPEYTAYKRSPHASVKCVECHIGSGADWFAKSKLSGAWQVVSVTLDLYPRPIPTPVHDLRPARETCQECHSPEKFVGDKLRVDTHYSNDEANTELKTVLLLRVGGKKPNGSQGIHWHVDPGNEIKYRSDKSRETIYDVELTTADGQRRLYKASEEVPTDEETEWRTMDCIDCHNRPTHIYGLPHDEVDLAIQEGKIDRGLPFIRKQAIAALEESYDSHDAARLGIETRIADYYAESHPELAAEKSTAIGAAAEALGDIYASNVFPHMKVDWATYPDHIGHEASDGCYRCHNDEHSTDDGEVISQDCDTCHAILAWEEEAPEILDAIEASS
ncbi:MAG: NapC/NirT family cytochrome c [Acidimicrobiia bacterium]|nr:NapC/NirT family cytochrome c [Acidimicrobiia bacterium]